MNPAQHTGRMEWPDKLSDRVQILEPTTGVEGLGACHGECQNLTSIAQLGSRVLQSGAEGLGSKE
eukprot:1750125-Rhodomonas_salina.1